MGGRRGTGDYAGALIMDDRTLLRLARFQGQSATSWQQQQLCTDASAIRLAARVLIGSRPLAGPGAYRSTLLRAASLSLRWNTHP